MIDRTVSSSVTSRRKSLRSSGKGSARMVRTASSSPAFSQIRSNGTSPEGRLRRQLQKHMGQNHPPYPHHNDYALHDLYNRLNGTLAHVEKIVNKIENSPKSKISRSEADQLILIQSALRELITPMRRQLDSDKVSQVLSTKSSKTSSNASYSSLRRVKSKASSSYSRKVESTESIQTVSNKSQPCRKTDSQTPANESTKSSINSTTNKDDNHSNDTTLEEFFLAKPGRAFHLKQQPSARSTRKSETETKCVDLFEDVGTSEDADDSEFTVNPKSISPIHHLEAPETESLFPDY
ncbi:unnamed protein product [Rodentolepis nana]|uniref:TBC1 domain family member 30 n=1 Tax=Rodentolepis nana TaxID=102285 RepID=A0A0R3TRU4_RODNA|nr:unnamed protein product [Rodentolepis nana]